MINQIGYVSLVLSLSFVATNVFAQGDRNVRKAPPNHEVLSSTLNGWYFVPKQLKAQYDNALKELESLDANVQRGLESSSEARTKLSNLKSSLAQLREKLEVNRVLVEGAKIHEQTTSLEFELGSEKRLAITANHVRVIGWNQSHVKAELRKLVLSPDGEPVQDLLDDIELDHQLGVATFAGKTDAQWEADEAEFMAEHGDGMTEEAKFNRNKFVSEIRQSFAIYREYLEKEVNTLNVLGLEYENNKSISIGAMSEGGSGQYGSVRQRYAELTVFVPKCTSLCVRGAKRGLKLEGIQANVLITDEGSTDSDARGDFGVYGIEGNLICREFPLQTIRDVTGQVDYVAGTEFGVEGAGTMHRDNIRDMTPAKPFRLKVSKIGDGLRMQCGRIQLELEDIAGVIDVSNDFGDTSLSMRGEDLSPHRLVSQSGRIHVDLDGTAFERLNLIAFTNHGGVRTNIPREKFEDCHFVSSSKIQNWRQNWNGFRKVIAGEERILGAFELPTQLEEVLHGSKQPPGFFLVTRAGNIEVLLK
jgi:hypothetical protein